MRRMIVYTLIILATLNLLDMACTVYLVSQFGLLGEGNPAMRVLLDISPFVFIAFKTLISFGIYLLAFKKQYIRNWMIVFVFPLLIYLWIVILSFYGIFLTIVKR